MIRVLIFFALLFAVALGFAWMADLPGVISISWDGYVWEQPPVVVALVVGIALSVFAWAVFVSGLYGRSPGAVRAYERLLRVMVWGIVLCFAWVVVRTGLPEPAALFHGLFHGRSSMAALPPSAPLACARTRLRRGCTTTLRTTL